ncbi:MAG: hypothetical protein HKO68_19685 [Desulfobacterales bacterium]|nr:hypothetical protein [Desulfobacterales bacterium]
MTDLPDKFAQATKTVSSLKASMRKSVYGAYFNHLRDIKTADLPEEIQPIFDAVTDRLMSVHPPGDIGNDEASYLAKDIFFMADVVKARYRP